MKIVIKNKANVKETREETLNGILKSFQMGQSNIISQKRYL